MIATAMGAVFSTLLPTFTTLPPYWCGTHGWFFSVVIGGGFYWVLAALRPRRAR